MMNRHIRLSDSLLDDLGGRSSANDQISSSELGQRLGLILLRAIDVNVSSKFLGQVLLGVRGREGNSLPTRLVCELNGQMTIVYVGLDKMYGFDVVMCTDPRPPRPWIATTAPGWTPMFLMEFCQSTVSLQPSLMLYLPTNEDGNSGTHEWSLLSGIHRLGDLAESSVIKSSILRIPSISFDTWCIIRS